MEKGTIVAIKQSVEHWEKNIDSISPFTASVEAADCALCQRFFLSDEDGYCDDCPIFEVTGFHGCKVSPYYSAWQAFSDWKEHDNKLNKDKWVKAATNMRDFLTDLLPEGEK